MLLTHFSSIFSHLISSRILLIKHWFSNNRECSQSPCQKCKYKKKRYFNFMWKWWQRREEINDIYILQSLFFCFIRFFKPVKNTSVQMEIYILYVVRWVWVYTIQQSYSLYKRYLLNSAPNDEYSYYERA